MQVSKEEFVRRLNLIEEVYGLNNTQVAKKLGLTKFTVSRIKNGDVPVRLLHIIGLSWIQYTSKKQNKGNK